MSVVQCAYSKNCRMQGFRQIFTKALWHGPWLAKLPAGKSIFSVSINFGLSNILFDNYLPDQEYSSSSIIGGTPIEMFYIQLHSDSTSMIFSNLTIIWTVYYSTSKKIHGIFKIFAWTLHISMIYYFEMIANCVAPGPLNLKTKSFRFPFRFS